jgi:maltooligosyltrehalose trehalohydrolase
MVPGDYGSWSAHIEEVPPGTRYTFALDRVNGLEERLDPASRWQPDGVHGPSAVVDLQSFTWHDEDWQGLARRDLVFYEVPSLPSFPGCPSCESWASLP